MKSYILISLTVLVLCSCDKSQNPGPLQPPNLQTGPASDTLKITVNGNNIPADNYSYAEIVAVSNLPAPLSRNITFTTDKGLFSNNSATLTLATGANDTTRAYLRYNKAEPARVTATVASNYSKEVFVNFINAFPTQVNVTADSTVLVHSLTAKSRVFATLLRNPGTASEGQAVHFYDSTASAPLRSIGSFFNTTLSGSTGQVSADYRLTDNTFTGLVYIKCYIDTPGGRIYGQNVILLQ
jgi:hypothetical protein